MSAVLRFPLAALRFAWEAVAGFVRDFLVASVREGVIRLKGLAAPMRAVIVVTTALLVGAVAVFAAGDIWRDNSPLAVLRGGVPGRGTLVPEVVVPVTLGLLAVGAALALAGALHAAVAIRLAVLVLYLAIALGFQGLASQVSDASGVSVTAGWVLIAAVVVVFAVRWRAAPKPALEFAVLLALAGGAFAVAQHALVEADRFSGTTFAVDQLNVLIRALVGLAFPLVYAAGLDVVSFGATASGWVLRFVDDRVSRIAVTVLLAALTAWRGRDLVIELVGRFDEQAAGDVIGSHIGALGLLLSLGALWWVAGRLAGRRPGMVAGDDDDIAAAAERSSLPLALVFTGLGTLVFFPLVLIVQDLGLLDVSNTRVLDWCLSLVRFFGRDSVTLTYRLVASGALVVVGLLLTRRNRRMLGLFVGAIGVTDLYQQLTVTGRPLAPIQWLDPGPVDLLWVLLFAGAGLWWFVRGQLSELRAERLLFLLLLTALIRQADFISDPLGPFLGFAGAGFVAFGLVWGFLTGGSWANENSKSLPRTSRVFLFLGYSLFSVTLLQWFASTHDLEQLSTFTGDLAANGQAVLGLPLLYAIFTVTFAGAIADRPLDPR